MSRLFDSRTEVLSGIPEIYARQNENPVLRKSWLENYGYAVPGLRNDVKWAKGI